MVVSGLIQRELYIKQTKKVGYEKSFLICRYQRSFVELLR